MYFAPLGMTLFCGLRSARDDISIGLNLLKIAVDYVDMELTGTTLIPAMNGIDDAIEKLYQLAKPENVHSVIVR